jgi:hypothetical protein
LIDTLIDDVREADIIPTGTNEDSILTSIELRDLRIDGFLGCCTGIGEELKFTALLVKIAESLAQHIGIAVGVARAPVVGVMIRDVVNVECLTKGRSSTDTDRVRVATGSEFLALKLYSSKAASRWNKASSRM